MKRVIRTTTIAALSVALLALPAPAGEFVYPAKGQSAEQQTKDEGFCSQWAKQQTGVDPALIAQQTVSGEAYVQPKGGFHKVLGGAVRGAALGSIGGAIGGDAGQGAAIGSAIGAASGLFRVVRQMREQAQYTKAVREEQEARLKEYEEAYSTCLRGRGYTVSQ